jgi:peptidoglycan/xylan/chitin deacetylase (PgdA/CDA1 family)
MRAPARDLGAVSDTSLKPERALAAYAKTALTWGRSTRWARRPASMPGSSADGFRILFYHRVSPERDLLAVHPRAFRRQMELLATEGWIVVDLMTAWAALCDGRLAPRTVALNFDDGYADIAEFALPVVRARGFGATVFIAPGVTEGTAAMPWYRTQPPLLSWHDIRRLHQQGFAFEPHSMTHPDLVALDDEAARREIVDSRRALEARLDREVHAFCYPAGRAGGRERRLVASAGLEVAVSCEPGIVRAASDRHWLPRVAVNRHDRIVDVRAKLYGAHDRPLPGRGAYQAVRYGRHDARALSPRRGART